MYVVPIFFTLYLRIIDIFTLIVSDVENAFEIKCHNRVLTERYVKHIAQLKELIKRNGVVVIKVF